MLDRFTNAKSGMANLQWALSAQPFTRHDAKLIDRLCEVVDLHEWEADETVFEQDSDGREIYCVLAGSFDILINARNINVRRAGQHFGEMSVLDPAVHRSATVRAREHSVTAGFREDVFAEIAEDYPFVWRMLAAEMADRLRQRSALVRPKNSRPKIFIGSSREGKTIVDALHEALQHDHCDIQPWTLGAFSGGRFPIEDLERHVASSDFAILAITADDEVVSRKVEQTAPRDNVIFELGLFMGALSRKRTFLLSQRGHDLKIPSDLIGINPLSYADGSPENLVARLGPACSELRRAIAATGCK